jgi:glycosyltransferase involved in cell wall biosynthesis
VSDLARWDVAILLGSDWEALEHHNTRWKQVALNWAHRDEVASVTVLDLPRWSWKRMAHPGRVVESRVSWASDVQNLRLTVPLPNHPLPGEGVLWHRLARHLDTSLRREPGRRLLVVAATPLSLELALHWPSCRRAFDAVDDWRDYPPAERWRARIEAGYRRTREIQCVTAVSPELSGRLTMLGAAAVTVPNGAPVWPTDLAGCLAPAGIPDRPYAVYVGNIEDRMDIHSVASLRAELPQLPVVMAGRTGSRMRQELDALGVELLGPIEPTLVAGLLGRACVGLLPHLTSGLALTQSSMKVYEYLAAGLPVASTIETESHLPGVVVQAPGESYGQTVARALSTSSPGHQHLRRWSDVADELWEIYTSDSTGLLG